MQPSPFRNTPTPFLNKDREHARHYISASDAEIYQMLESLHLSSLEQLFSHIPHPLFLAQPLPLPPELPYETIQSHILAIAQKNKVKTSFIADALPVYKTHPIINEISKIRTLTTSYTPYQPERSQGTLISLWIYQSLLAQITGFEAINASLYDRSTALFEAISCACHIKHPKRKILLSEGLFPQDIEVIKTLVPHTLINIETVPLDPLTGTTSLKTLKEKIKTHADSLAAIAFPQINQLGLLEDVHTLANIAHTHQALAIASIDPMLLSTDGLIPPSQFGLKGADIIIGEGQHLATPPNFGGPSLGIFGVRYNNETKDLIRSTPGRFVGKTKDIFGNPAFTLVLSTREQHIRKEKATSNICSNQSFLATLAGAAILARGEDGMKKACKTGYDLCHKFVAAVTQLEGIQLTFPHTPFFNECLITLHPSPLLQKARTANLHLGIDMSNRIPNPGEAIKISFSDIHSDSDLHNLIAFFESHFPKKGTPSPPTIMPSTPQSYLRAIPLNLPSPNQETILSYYQKLGELNISPDTGPYPLGSCTMKYNPLINDWAASLPQFTDIHPQAPIEDAQGCLQILYEIQEWFKIITGLSAVTTQPVAGAQAELLSLKLFQAYHAHNKNLGRNIILIPKSAHGTNFASAASAGFPLDNIIHLSANAEGQIDISDLDAKISQYGNRIAGIMITNPNTSGIFETHFELIANKIHAAGGLVFMDGANLNAIAGWIDLNKLGVDAVHSNLHKTFSIPHGGGGPGDAIVAVSHKLAEFLPGYQVIKIKDTYELAKPKHSIGSFHRHFGNFAHKVRCYTYLIRLGREGIPRMSAVAVLAPRYLLHKIQSICPTLPINTSHIPRMHEFIITLSEKDFQKCEAAGTPRPLTIQRIGKLFLDFGFHAPTVGFPEPLGLMIETTESFTTPELDRFAEAILSIYHIIQTNPLILNSVPLFTPVRRIDEVFANRYLQFSELISSTLPPLPKGFIPIESLHTFTIPYIQEKILALSNKGPTSLSTS